MPDFTFTVTLKGSRNADAASNELNRVLDQSALVTTHSLNAPIEYPTGKVQFMELEVSGEVLSDLQAVAAGRRWTVEDVVKQTLVEALQRPLVSAESDADSLPGLRVKPYVINEGNGGFHMFTVVTDGYGYLVAEDAHGKELAREKVVDLIGDPDHNEFRLLAIKAMAKLDENYV